MHLEKRIQWRAGFGLELGSSSYLPPVQKQADHVHAHPTQAVHLQVIFWLFSVLTA